MNESCDGDLRNSFEVDDCQPKLFEAQNMDDDNALSTEGFRGFEKVPIVLCQRIDMTPYLQKTNDSLTPDVNTNTNENSNMSINKLLRNCSVVLVRDDLDKLKQMGKNNSPINEISCFKCDICNKSYSNEKKLQNHQENKHIVYKSQDKLPKRVSFSDHIVVHEVKEYHRCRKCPKIFEDYNTLKIHMKQKHKKRKCYVCFYCSRDFVDRTFFKVHIKLHCDSCGLLLANKKKYSEHRRYVCRIIKKYECKTCDLTFFNYMDLKDHSYDHLGTFFICDICKDQFESKCAVAHHIKFLHSKKRPDILYSKQALGIDNVYVCNFCEESSIDLDIIEKHVSTLPDLQNRAMTGYKDYYFCDQCLKKFNTETDMLQHKWTHFLKISDNSKSNKNILKTTYHVNEKLPEFLQPKLILEKVEIPEEQPYKQLRKLLEKDFVDNCLEDVPIERKLVDNNHLNLNKIPKKAVVDPISKKTIEIPKKAVVDPISKKTIEIPKKAVVDPISKKTIEIPKKAVVDPISKKTIISKYQCAKCFKYLSSNYCLTRHMHTVHGIVKDTFRNKLRCHICDEVFVWPSLLQNHNCIRLMRPEMPFDDARPEIHFDNSIERDENTLNGMDITDDDYMNADFEIPAPIVQLTEYEDLNIVVNGGNGQLNIINNKTYQLTNEKTCPVNNLSYRLVMQEVPIEF